MSGGTGSALSREPGGALLERERELATLNELIERAAAGSCALALVEGAPGIGKTRLVEEARRRGEEAGLRVLGARGAQLEREFAFGVVRQLFESELMDERRGEEVFAGAAGPARAVLEPDRQLGVGASGESSFAALHGLYWLTVNLSELSPVVLVVDDLHWSDRASLRFLAYLARRLEGLPVLLVCSQRPSEPAADKVLLAELEKSSFCVVLRPRPLSGWAVAGVVRERLGEDAEEAFIGACHSSTAGNPLLLDELIKAMRADGVSPYEVHAGLVLDVGPKAVSRAVLLRLERLGEQAVVVARAVAVLGGLAEPLTVAALAGVDEGQAARAIAALVRDEVLRSEPPLGFVHPLVRDAVYSDIVAGERELHHTRAARLLADTGAPAEQVAAHLLTSPPRSEAWIIETLRSAARLAGARGAPECAVAYLRRALAEPPQAASRLGVLRELGEAELVAREAGAVDHLKEAHSFARDAATRAEVALVLAGAFESDARWDEANHLIDQTIDELKDEHPELLLRLQTLAAQTQGTRSYTAAVEARIDELVRLARDGGRGARPLQSFLGRRAALLGASRDEVCRLVDQALDGGRLIADETSDAIGPSHAISALVVVDELDRAERVEDDMEADARRRGSVLGYALTAERRGWIALRRGAIETAETDCRAALALVEEHELRECLPFVISSLVGALLERGQIEESAEMLERVPCRAFEDTVAGAYVLEARGALQLAQGRPDEAVASLRAVGELVEALGVTNPNAVAWRSALAVAVAGSSLSEAFNLVEQELELARRVGLPRAVGVALRTRGLLLRDAEGIESLREAVATLERSPARLEHAKALAALGTALRHARRPAEAREPLAEALDLADRCGASVLADQARQELLASGARPRRFRRWGLDSLTPSELRVAKLAAQGRRNREIAQALFVTPKTVEIHLSRCYRKLDVSGREQLAEALQAGDLGASSAEKSKG